MKKVVFIGNRINVFDVLWLNQNELEITKVFVLRNSLLHKNMDNYQIDYELFDICKNDKFKLFEFLKTTEFDLLISNGCPFVIPINELNKDTSKVLFINTHPSYLPHLKGKTPLNAVFMMDYNFIGATTHFMDDGIDSGNIIYQEKIEITTDIDQGLVYFISFKLENIVFKKALEVLKNSNYIFEGKPQEGGGTYFNRKDEEFIIDFSLDTSEIIIKKINSLGMTNLYNLVNIEGKDYKVHNCDLIINSFLNEQYLKEDVGKIICMYSDKMLVKTLDGIVKLSYI